MQSIGPKMMRQVTKAPNSSPSAKRSLSVMGVILVAQSYLSSWNLAHRMSRELEHGKMTIATLNQSSEKMMGISAFPHPLVSVLGKMESFALIDRALQIEVDQITTSEKIIRYHTIHDIING